MLKLRFRFNFFSRNLAQFHSVSIDFNETGALEMLHHVVFLDIHRLVS